uniref:WEB family protein n=1 Tax=Populus trichocarpa TaxID=3694 RepID=A0A2K1WNB0_POPTR
METPTLSPKPAKDYSSSVDTSRPFRSVKEAVAIFGKRFLVGEIYSSKPYYNPPGEENISWRFLSPNPSYRSPKEDHHHDQNEVFGALMKLEAELNLLKERESETEIALASLNAELHKNMSKEERMRELMIRTENSPTLAQILSLGEEKGCSRGKEERKAMKKKPIVPLVGDFFFKKKGSSNTHNNPLYASPEVYFN